MDQRIIDLYDSFTHGRISRRNFLDRLAALAGRAGAASVLLSLLQNNYALAQTIPESDARIATETLTVPAVKGLNGYLVKPQGGSKHPAVIVIHENRGLNPHIKDVARRLGTQGYLALAVDYLGPGGGTPADDDKAREMFGALKPADVLASSRAALAALKAHANSNGRVGAVGFCWGGGQVNALAVADPTLDAGVAYYGRQPPAEAVVSIKVPLLLHYAGLDEPTNAGIPAFEAALKQGGKTYEIYVYPGVNHAFNNDTNASRYDKAAADLAWSRTLAFLKKYLGESSRT